MPTNVRRSADRFVTPTAWGESRHCFSFGSHYDPDNTHFGLLVACNEELVPPGEGFGPHEHHDVEIVTWVLQGALRHEDSTGHSGVTRPGVVQRMTAGSGVTHSEVNDPSGGGPVRFVQSWVRPPSSGAEPGYAQADLNDELDAGGLVVVASGSDAPTGVTLAQPDATMYVARLTPGSSVPLPAAPYVHLFVALGGVELDGAGRLQQGDSARMTADRFTPGLAVTDVLQGSEIIVWEMRSSIAPPPTAVT